MEIGSVAKALLGMDEHTLALEWQFRPGRPWTDEERAAIRDRVDEAKANARDDGMQKTDGESAALAKIAALPQPDRAFGERLHA